VLQTDLMFEDIRFAMFSLAPLLLMTIVMMFVPQYSDKQGCLFTCVLLVSSCIAVSKWILLRATAETLKRYALVNDITHQVARTLAHMVWLTFHHDDIYARFLNLFIAPVDAALVLRTTSFNVYIAMHIMLTIYRFQSDPLGEAAPWVFAVIIQSQMLLGVSALKKRSADKSMEAHRVYLNSCELAVDAVRNIMSCFCDASAVLSSDLKLIEGSPTLHSLLDRQASKDKDFRVFIHMADREEYRSFISSLLQASQEDSQAAREQEKSKQREARLQVRSVHLNMEDGYSVPLSVHAFHASIEAPTGEPVIFVGINEAWRPPGERSKRGGGRSTAARPSRPTQAAGLGRVDVSTGRLEPTTPVYPKQDAHLRTSGLAAAIDPAGAARPGQEGSRQRRADTPRPRERSRG